MGRIKRRVARTMEQQCQAEAMVLTFSTCWVAVDPLQFHRVHRRLHPSSNRTLEHLTQASTRRHLELQIMIPCSSSRIY